VKPDDYSNIAYLLAGIWLLFTGAILPAIGLFTIAFGSFMAHQYGGKWWKTDWYAMNVAFGSIIAFNTGWWWVMIPSVLLILKDKWYVENYVLLGIYWVASVASAYYAGVNIIPAIILFALALGIRQWGHENHYQHTHSLWHALTAIGFVLLTFTT